MNHVVYSLYIAKSRWKNFSFIRQALTISSACKLNKNSKQAFGARYFKNVNKSTKYASTNIFTCNIKGICLALVTNIFIVMITFEHLQELLFKTFYLNLECSSKLKLFNCYVKLAKFLIFNTTS